MIIFDFWTLVLAITLGGAFAILMVVLLLLFLWGLGIAVKQTWENLF